MLVEARLRLEELLHDFVQRPEVAGPLALELEQTFCVLRVRASGNRDER